MSDDPVSDPGSAHARSPRFCLEQGRKAREICRYSLFRGGLCRDCPVAGHGYVEPRRLRFTANLSLPY